MVHVRPTLYTTGDEELYEIFMSLWISFLSMGRQNHFHIQQEAEFQDGIWGRKYAFMGWISYYNICREEEKRKVIQSAERHLDYIMACRKGIWKKKITETSGYLAGNQFQPLSEPVVLLYHRRKSGRLAAYKARLQEPGN